VYTFFGTPCTLLLLLPLLLLLLLFGSHSGLAGIQVVLVTDRALLIQYSAETLLTVRLALSIAACCIRKSRPGQRLSRFKQLRTIFGITLMVLYRVQSVVMFKLALLYSCTFPELLGDGAGEFVTVGNCNIYSICFYDGLVKHICMWPFFMD